MTRTRSSPSSLLVFFQALNNESSTVLYCARFSSMKRDGRVPYLIVLCGEMWVGMDVSHAAAPAAAAECAAA